MVSNYLIREEIKYSNHFYFLGIKAQVYICCIEYRLGGIYSSNQSTFHCQRPSVKRGIWVQAGDLLADSSDSLCGQFAVGRNLLLGYIPWDGLNFEDAVIGNENLVTKEIFTSAHIEEWVTSSMRIQFGIEIFVPFSKQLVICIRRGKRKSWTESIFVSNNADSIRARIFTIEEELDFAGHPIVGLAAHLHDESGESEPQEWKIDLNKKSVIVKTKKTEQYFHASMGQGVPEFTYTLSNNETEQILNKLIPSFEYW